VDNEAGTTNANGGLHIRMLHWLDERTGVKAIARKLLDEPIPGGARLAYVFGSGLLFIFLLQAITGVSLALYYTPTAETAHTSVAYITKQVAGGAFLRSLHSYGSSAMIIVLGLHFLQTFLYGSFKGRRELLWLSGALLSFLILGMGFTGYLLPWDQKAYFATAVGTNVAGQTPLIGNLLTRIMRGGDTIGTLTLSRFYVAHVFLIPATIFLFIAAHIFLFRKAGPAGPVKEDPITPKLASEPFYPRQVLFDMGFVLLIMSVLAGLSYLRPVTLGPIANPADTHFLPRPEWYYLPMFEWLKFWEGPKVVLGVVVIPGLLAMAFFLMPFLDRRLERQPWRRPIPALAVAVVVFGMVFLGVRSEIEDKQGPNAAQLALQEQQERAYSAEPFQPYVEEPDGARSVEVAEQRANPLVAVGKGIFTTRGCVGCHGPMGTGTAAAPSLVGVTKKYPEPQLVAMLHDPNPRMRAGRMPAVDASQDDMNALLAYLGALGTRAASVPAVLSPVVPSSPIPNNETRTIAMETGGPAATRPPDFSKPAFALAATGQQLFQERACFACHGQTGGGGRAPALAPRVARLTDSALNQVLATPNEKMRAGGMPPVVGSPEQLAALIAYLRTLPLPQVPNKPIEDSSLTSNAALPEVQSAPPASSNTSDPSPEKVAAKVDEAAMDLPPGRKIFLARGCVACHGISAQGTQIAPALIGVAARFPGDKLLTLLRNPTSKMRDKGMPAVTLNDNQMRDLVAYLSSLGATPAPQPETAKMSQAAAPPPTSASTANPTEGKREFSKIALNPLVYRGQIIFQRNGCGSCHGEEGLHGTVAAPGLAGTASLLPAQVLENLLRHHSIQMQKGGMPPTNFNARDMEAIVDYIRSMPGDVEEQSLTKVNPRDRRN
jgi:ubiquinol-cytochrome c reductase cytochrome b subunit